MTESTVGYKGARTQSSKPRKTHHADFRQWALRFFGKGFLSMPWRITRDLLPK